MKGLYAGIDTLEITRKRFEIMFAAKLRGQSRIYEAVQVQDKLRKKSKNWNGSEEIRKRRNQKLVF